MRDIEQKWIQLFAFSFFFKHKSSFHRQAFTVGKAVPLPPDTIVCLLNTCSMGFPLDSFTSLLSHSRLTRSSGLCAAFCSLSACLPDISQGVWAAFSTLIPLGDMTYCLVTPVTPVSVHLCAVHLCKCTCSICPTRILMREGFPGGPVVKDLPCNAEDTGSIPGWGAKNPHAPQWAKIIIIVIKEY